MDIEESPWARLANVEVSAKDILLEAKLGGAGAVLNAVGLRRAFAKRAEAEGVRVSDAEIDEGIEELRAGQGVREDAQLAPWLKRLRLGRPELREAVRERLLAEKLKLTLASDEAIRGRFAAGRPDHLRASVEIASFATEGAARILLARLRDGEAQWPGGRPLELCRAEAPPQIASALFSPEPGEFFGPLGTEKGVFEVWRLVTRKDAVLDGELRRKLREEIVSELAQALLRKDPLEFLL